MIGDDDDGRGAYDWAKAVFFFTSNYITHRRRVGEGLEDEFLWCLFLHSIAPSCSGSALLVKDWCMTFPRSSSNVCWQLCNMCNMYHSADGGVPAKGAEGKLGTWGGRICTSARGLDTSRLVRHMSHIINPNPLWLPSLLRNAKLALKF